jgi:dTDP-4-amino-4,6-dideoxygalactose transaminase
LLDRITAELRAKGVPAFRRYPMPLHRQPVFERMGLGAKPYPVADRLALELLSLPVHPLISDAHVDRMVESVVDVLAGCS